MLTPGQTRAIYRKEVKEAYPPSVEGQKLRRRNTDLPDGLWPASSLLTE